jgi:mRNA-degrading endonuclease toxin of MazEF toxin-antitoxin module
MARGEIAFIDLPLSTRTRVQGGRRPAILVIADDARTHNPLVTIVPLTTNTAATRFPFTFQVDPTPRNGLSAPSIARQMLGL